MTECDLCGQEAYYSSFPYVVNNRVYSDPLCKRCAREDPMAPGGELLSEEEAVEYVEEITGYDLKEGHHYEIEVLEEEDS